MGYRAHILLCELACDVGHAVGFLRFALFGFPATELGVEVVAWQAQQAGTIGRHPRQCQAMALCAGGYFAGRVTLGCQAAALFQNRLG